MWGFHTIENLNPNHEGYEQTIKNHLGDFPLWRVVTWNQGHWLKIRVGSEWLYTQGPIIKETADAEVEIEKYVEDGDHMLFFPMDQEGLCPRAWFEAAWSFIEHFRSNFCFYPQEAFMYKTITLIGRPVGTRYGIAQEIEDALRDSNWRQVERIWCTSADDLRRVLQRRIEEGTRFRGRDELSPQADG
ncbi:MAG TPA: hypothetical protein ENN99_07185 [Chloroflexi bacterium]|nr:hypothetical protein [Chloroflexota bacterium]